MIIKSLTRKTATYRQLLSYILKEQKNSPNKADNFVIKYNLTGPTSEQWVKQFEANEANRRIKRSNSVKIYHELMSISNLDTGYVSKAILQDLAHKYIELRNPNSMCIATSHHDKNHVHIHFMFGGAEIETGKALRVSKEDFATFKRELQEYQVQKYPELSHSIVRHGKNKRIK